MTALPLTKVQELLDEKIQHNKKIQSASKEALKTNYNFNLSWYGEDLYMANVLLELLCDLNEAIRENTPKYTTVLEQFFERYSKHLDYEWKLESNSTNQLSNLGELWSYRAHLRFVKIIRECRGEFFL